RSGRDEHGPAFGILLFGLFGRDDDTVLDSFFSQPLEARLARLRGGRGSGEDFAKIVRRALATGTPEDEIVSMVQEYLGAPEHLSFVKQDTWDALDALDIHREFKALWELVPDVPLLAGYALLTKLPTVTEAWGGFGDDIPNDVLDRMDDQLLAYLLERDDVGLHDLRKKIALSRDPKSDYTLIRAAVSRHFDLTNEQFTNVLRSDRARLKLMSEAVGMRAVLHLAASDACDADHDYRTLAEFKTTYAEHLRRTRGRRRRDEVYELRLYELAKCLAERPSNGEAWLRQYIEGGDVWITYVKLAAAAEGALRSRYHPEK